ncbi:SprT-like domain-containing protein [Clostridium aminobutyricum]|uniref:SprT-like domain-containing protein n=2 Tax=Clostridium aminobutyricum TaxID=33953 RepID=A0A939D8X5_CLOAM|nr:SprT-like domain-containing protein [Clostridium aminobutyricum]
MEINQLFGEVLEEAAALGIPFSRNIHQKVIINKRAKSRFGCCKKIKCGLKTEFEIELSHRLLCCDKKLIKQTLAHELLHTCPRCDNHGSIWKAYAQKWNTAFGYQIKRTGSAEELGLEKNLASRPLKENYIVVCKNCGAKIARTRLSPVIKYPHHYRCKCGGNLQRVK